MLPDGRKVQIMKTLKTIVPLLFAAMAAMAVAGCDMLLPLLVGQNRDCTFTVEEKAPMFHVAAPATASAGVAFDVVPWVYRSAGSYPKGDEVIPGSFAAVIDTASRTITITGNIRRTNVRPNANCAIPAIAVLPSAATLSVPVTATASGTYTVRIPGEYFTTQTPSLYGLPNEPPNGYPQPLATRSVEVL